MTSRRKPSSTIRIFSSGVYLRRVAEPFGRRTSPPLYAHQRPLLYLFLSGTSLAPLSEVIYLIKGALHTSNFSAFPTPSPVPLSLTIYTGAPSYSVSRWPRPRLLAKASSASMCFPLGRTTPSVQRQTVVAIGPDAAGNLRPRQTGLLITP